MNRTVINLFAGILWTVLFLTECSAADYILFASTKHNIFKGFIQGATATTTDSITVVYITSTKTPELQKELRKVRNGSYNGIMIAGKTALDAIKSGLPTNIPVALCTYNEISQEAMTLKHGTQYAIYKILTPLTKYGPLISKLFPDCLKVAIIHLTDFQPPEIDGIETKSYQVGALNELKGTLTKAIKWCDVIWLPADPAFTSTALIFIVRESLKSKTPLITSSPRIIKGGAVAGIVRSPSDIGQAAVRWLKSCVKKGYKAPSNMKTIKSELVNNAKVARFLGVKIPEQYAGRKTIKISDYK